MIKLQIKKKSTFTWEHIDIDLGVFILSKFYFSADGTKFQVVEKGGSKRRIYDISEIEVYDIGGTAETFINTTLLSIRLEALSYPAFNFANGFPDAPADSNIYGRKNNGWFIIDLSSKQDVLTETNFGAFADTLNIKLTPSANDEIVTLDSLTGKAVTIEYSSFSGSSNQRHIEVIRAWNQSTVATASTWYGERTDTNDYDTGQLQAITLSGVNLDSNVWRGRPLPFDNAKLIRSCLYMKAGPSTGTCDVRLLIVRKDYPDGTDQSSPLNYTVLVDYTVNKSLISGAFFIIPLTINTHSAMNNNSRYYWAIQKSGGGTLTTIDLLTEFEKQP